MPHLGPLMWFMFSSILFFIFTLFMSFYYSSLSPYMMFSFKKNMNMYKFYWF